MNIVLLQPHDWIAANLAVVRDQRALHLRTELKAQESDSLQVGLLGGLCGCGWCSLNRRHPGIALTSCWRCPGRRCCGRSCTSEPSSASPTCT
jgi:hypothetical protein